MQGACHTGIGPDRANEEVRPYSVAVTAEDTLPVLVQSPTNTGSRSICPSSVVQVNWGWRTRCGCHQAQPLFRPEPGAECGNNHPRLAHVQGEAGPRRDAVDVTVGGRLEFAFACLVDPLDGHVDEPGRGQVRPGTRGPNPSRTAAPCRSGRTGHRGPDPRGEHNSGDGGGGGRSQNRRPPACRVAHNHTVATTTGGSSIATTSAAKVRPTIIPTNPRQTLDLLRRWIHSSTRGDRSERPADAYPHKRRSPSGLVRSLQSCSPEGRSRPVRSAASLVGSGRSDEKVPAMKTARKASLPSLRRACRVFRRTGEPTPAREPEPRCPRGHESGRMWAYGL